MSITQILLAKSTGAIGPFCNHPNINIVDLRNTNFLDNDASYAFYNCRNLRTVTNLPNSIVNLSNAFRYCNNLTSFPVLPQNTTNLYSAFLGCDAVQGLPIIPNNVNSMQYTFYGCNHITDIPHIPDSVTNISRCFMLCKNIVTITNSFPNYAYSFPFAFSSCNNLTTVPVLPSCISEFQYCFSGCVNLTGNIYIPAPDITSAANSFNGTSLTKDVYIPFTSPCQDHLFCFVLADLPWGCRKYIYTKTLSLTTSTPLYDGIGNPIEYTITATNDSALKPKIYIQGDTIRYYIYNSTCDLEYGTNTKTYNAFTTAGYSTTSRVNGVLLMNWTPTA